jgi:hypothetical protein
MNHYKKIQEEMDKQQAEAAKWAAEAAASSGANVINAQPINWWLVLIVFGLIALGIALAIGLTSLGRRVLKSWHGTRNADVEVCGIPSSILEMTSHQHLTVFLFRLLSLRLSSRLPISQSRLTLRLMSEFFTPFRTTTAVTYRKPTSSLAKGVAGLLEWSNGSLL